MPVASDWFDFDNWRISGRVARSQAVSGWSLPNGKRFCSRVKTWRF